MPTINKKFSGIMNLDDNNDVLPPSHHRSATNIVFRGSAGDKIAQSVFGNRLISNANLPATGTNSCIGSFYDQQKQRLFYFNYNSLGNHGIYIFNTSAGTIQKLFLNSADAELDPVTSTFIDILNFDINNPITSINIIYGDAYSSDQGGDVLMWVDSLGRPSKMNVDRKLAGVYTRYKRSYIDVAKAPPVMPPQCVYENDVNVTNNNLKGTLFQFIYRWTYDDGEKSVWSSGSAVPLPLFSNNIDVNADPKKNSRINVFFSTGDATVREIDIAVRMSLDDSVSEYGLARTIKKSEITGPAFKDDIAWNFLFYNDTTLIPVDTAEQVLLQDYVPQFANAQELLNGNTVIYGGITEGYDNPTISGTVTRNPLSSYLGNINGMMFFASQAGRLSYGNSTSIEVYLTGAGTNDPVTNQVTDIDVALGASFNIYIGSNHVKYLSSTTTSISTILNNLATDAIANGYSATVVGNKLTISEPGLPYQLKSSYANSDRLATPYATNSAYKNNVLSSLVNSGSYKFGLVYYDDKGRTNGAVQTEGFKLTTTRYTSDNDFMGCVVQITSTPPSWAHYYHIVRTDNLTYGKNLFWVTNNAFYTTVSNTQTGVQQNVIYLGIGNMTDYNENIQSSTGYIGYEYSKGDRIKFLGRFQLNGNKINFSANEVADFEIIGVEEFPTIEGATIPGRFIKITNPTTTYGGNIIFFGPNQTGVISPLIVPAEDFRNYEIQIYNYKTTSSDNEFYYEMGEQYGIQNPGQANRYHIGRTQTQTSVLPAEIPIHHGDNYYRFRNVPIGQSFTFTAGQYGQGDTFGAYAGRYRTVNINVWNADNTPKTISNAVYEIKSQVIGGSTTSLVATDYPNYSTADYMFYNKSAGTQTIRIRGKLPVSTVTSNADYVAIHAKVVLNATTAAIIPIVKRVPLTEANRQYEIEFDARISVPTLAKVFLMTETHDDVGFKISVGAFVLTLNLINDANIGIIEKYFSDDTRIMITNDSRPVIYDETAKREYYPTLVRYSLPNQAGTKINGTNRFFPANMDEYDRQKGDIVRLRVRGSRMRVFQNRGCGAVGVFQSMMSNLDNTSNLIQTDRILNKINYYSGEYGIGWLATSLVSSGEVDYFVDPIRGYQLRVSGDGITPISAIYKAQYYMTNLATKYSTPSTGTLGGKAKVLGAYDFNEEEYIAVFQAFGANENVTIGFNEYSNSYTSFYSYAPEWITSVLDKVISFKNGNLYAHDSTSSYSNFYGVQYNASATFVFNEPPMIRKDFNSVGQDSSVLWTSETIGDVTTSLGQNSNLVASDWDKQEGYYYAAFMRDNGSIGGLIDGDYLKGGWIQIKLNKSSSNLVYLSGLYLNYTVSQRNY